MNIVPSEKDIVNLVRKSPSQLMLDQIGMIWNKKQNIDVECSFSIGDIYNKGGFHSGSRHHDCIERYGELQKTFSAFARVARHWPPHERRNHAGKAWRFYRQNTPEGIASGKIDNGQKKIPDTYVDMGSVEIVDGMACCTSRDNTGKIVSYQYFKISDITGLEKVKPHLTK